MTKPDIVSPVAEIIRSYWRSDRWTLLLVATIVLASSIAAVAAPYLFSRMIDRMQGAPAAETLALGFLLYAALVGLSSALQQMVQYLSYMSAENLGFIASTRFFERLLRKSAAFFVEHNPAEIQSAGQKGRNALSMLVQLGLIVFIPGLAQIALTLATLGAMIDPTIALIVLAYGAASIALSWYANHLTRPLLDAAISAEQENARFVGNAMTAMETLRHFGGHDWMTGRFEAKARLARESWRGFSLRHVSFGAARGLGLAVQVAATFLILLPQYRAGAVSLGEIVLFNALLLQLNQPFEMIGHAIDDVVRARSTIAPFARMWAAPEERQVAQSSAFAATEGRIVFENVGFAYENGRGVDGVSFTAERGRITFLTGETGSGKSTLFRLALKSIEPARGRILVDGVDLASIDRADWYAAIAVTPQDIVLLNDSLADNILLGRERDEARLRRAAEKAAILSFIDALPDGFDTAVGERGLKLSGGERQRVAIARALYGDPAILFLDEASSALDSATEADIVDHIRSIAGDVTILAITHRKSVIAANDKVVVLDSAVGCDMG